MAGDKKRISGSDIRSFAEEKLGISLTAWQYQFLYYAFPENAEHVDIETLDGNRHRVTYNPVGPPPLSPEDAQSWVAELSARLAEHSFEWNTACDWATCTDCGWVATGDTMGLIPVACKVPKYASFRLPTTDHHGKTAHTLRTMPTINITHQSFSVLSCPCGRGHRMICPTHGPENGP